MANKTLTSIKFPGLSDTYLVPVVAQAFSSNNTYAVGAYCTYQGQIYKCTTAVETAGDFDASDWTAVSVSDDLAGLISAEVTRSSGVEGSLSNLTTTAKGNLVAAINEVDANADANAASISTLNSNIGSFRCGYIGVIESTQTSNTFTLPTAGTWIIFTCHNSTDAVNTMWIYRTGSGKGFRLGTGNGATSIVSMSGSGTSVTVSRTTTATIQVYGILLGNN